MTFFKVLSLILLIGSLANLARAIYQEKMRAQAPSAPPRRTPPPMRRPPSTAPPTVRPSAAEAGAAEHRARGVAQTAKLPPVVPPLVQDQTRTARELPAAGPDKKSVEDATAMESLFAGLKDEAPTPAAPPGPEDVKKASRIQELNFHPGTVPVTPAATAPAPAAPTSTSSTAPAVAPVIASSPAAPAAPPRTQTQELDDILRRIDAVLSDQTAPSAELTMAGQQAPTGNEAQTMIVAEPPPADKPSEPPTMGEQQKLF